MSEAIPILHLKGRKGGVWTKAETRAAETGSSQPYVSPTQAVPDVEERVEPDETNESQPVQVELRVPEALTPLPAVDRALPILSLFAGIVGRRRARYKVALLKSLQAHGSGRWKIRDIQEAADWLEPSSITWLVAELRDAGVLSYDSMSLYYRLSPESRVVIALIEALTVPEIEPRRLIRFLNKAMGLAIAAGAGEDVVFAQFRSAVQVLRGDREEVRRLIDDFSETALLEAARLAQAHVEDMRDLLDEHESFFIQNRDRTHFLDADQDALDLIASLGQVSAEVIDALTGRADDRMRLGLLIDRGDLREFLAQVGPEVAGSIVAGLVGTPAAIFWISSQDAFDSLDEALGRTRAETPALPQPQSLERFAPEMVPDLAQQLVEELRGLKHPVTVAGHVVRDSWAVSVGRHSALLEAYSRYPSDLPEVEHLPSAEQVDRADVWRVSKSILRPGP